MLQRKKQNQCQRQGGVLRKTAFIVNSIAIRRCGAKWHWIEEYIKGNWHSFCDVRVTESDGQATHLTRDAVRSGCQVVVAVGGDGTVNEVVNGLFEKGIMFDQDLVLAIIPLGSGCDLARSLGIPSEIGEVIKAVEGNSTRRIDVGMVDFVNLSGGRERRHFVNIADLGGGGLVVQKANRAPRILGRRPNYLWGILSTAFSYKARMMNVSIDGGEPLRLAAKNLIVANGRYFGRGFLKCGHHMIGGDSVCGAVASKNTLAFAT
jgi:diacylglycerol kinase (ATP)